MTDDLDGRRWSQLAYIAGTGVVAIILLLTVARRSLAVDFYFDEMWRYDMIRDASPRSRALLHDTPVPPGWLYTMHYLLAPLPSSRSLARAVALIPFGVGLALLADVLRMVSQRAGMARQRARVVGALSVWTACVVPAIAAVAVYFNNYGFELAAAGLLLWAAARIQLRAVHPTLLLALIAVLPLFTQGALLMLPAVAVLWYRGHITASRRQLAFTAAGASASLLIVWLFFYRPLAAGNLVDYWSDERLGAGGMGSFIGHFADQFVDALVPSSNQQGGVLVVLLTLAALTYGLFIAGRNCWSYVAFVAVGQLGAFVASLVVSWPATPVRVNLAFIAPLAVLIPFGLLTLVSRVLDTRTVPGPANRLEPARIVALSGISAALVIAVWPRSITASAMSQETFARGLTNDLRIAADLSGSTAIVLGYHPMSHWYIDNVFRHDHPHAMDVVVLRETQDRRLYDDVDQLVSEQLTPGADVWCIIPYEIGPDATTAACDLRMPALTEFYRERLDRALVIGFRSTTPAP